MARRWSCPCYHGASGCQPPSNKARRRPAPSYREDSLRTVYPVAFALCLGALLGATIATGLRAQGTPQAFAIIEVAEILDSSTFDKVLQSTPIGLVPFNGRYIVRSDKILPLEGTPPKRFVVIAFDTLERAQRWSASSPVKETNTIRRGAAVWRSFLVEGVAH